jgi:hypothetical protein
VLVFGYVSWDPGTADADVVRRNIFGTFPDRTKACLFLSRSAVFAIDNLASFWNVEAKLKTLQTASDFHYAATVHDNLTTFAGQAEFELTPEVRRAMGLG